MTTSMWVGFVVILFVTIAFMGPGLFSDRTDYPFLNWLRSVLGSGKASKAAKSEPPPAPKRNDPR